MTMTWARRTVTGEANSLPLRRSDRNQARSLARKVLTNTWAGRAMHALHQRTDYSPPIMRGHAVNYKDVGLPRDLHCLRTSDFGSLQEGAVDNEDGIIRGDQKRIIGGFVRGQINNPSLVAAITARPERYQNPADERWKVIGVVVVALGGKLTLAAAILTRVVVAVHRQMDSRPPESPHGDSEFTSERRLSTGSYSVDGYPRWMIQVAAAHELRQSGDGVAARWIHSEPLSVKRRGLAFPPRSGCVSVGLDGCPVEPSAGSRRL